MVGVDVAQCRCKDGFEGNPAYPDYNSCYEVMESCLDYVVPEHADAYMGACETYPGSYCNLACDDTYTINGTLTGSTVFMVSCNNGEWTGNQACLPVPGEWVSSPYVREYHIYVHVLDMQCIMRYRT